MRKSRNSPILQQLTLHSQQIIKATSTQDLDPRSLSNNDHPSNPLGFLIHIKRRTIDDRFPLSLWEVWFCSTLGVSIPSLIGPSQRCTCNAFHYDDFGDHFQTCQVKSVVSQVHDWVVYRLGVILGSVGHKVQIHKITPATGKERGDLEIKDYVVLQT